MSTTESTRDPTDLYRAIDPVISARVDAAQGLAVQCSSIIETVEAVLRSDDTAAIGNTGAVELATTLAMAKRMALGVADRLDTPNLLDKSRRIVVVTTLDELVTEA